ncbi:MAG: ribosome biogenesis GTPase YlqF [Lachnospiraceae bacterium]|nr:ribosome biogenesis GTPase YlqF [Lachnospiraceae bacterium]
MDIQWYPGHMTKAIRQMKEDIKVIDLIIELLDARIPLASRNPEIDSLGAGKARLLLLNKRDLSDDKITEEWLSYFREKGFVAIAMDARKKSDVKRVDAAVEEACKKKRERNKKRGIMNRPIRAMVVGIPNIGKSSFINSYAGRAAAKTGNTPGVTKGKQWIRLKKDLELLDTPGILWPKFEDKRVGQYLAALGAIRTEVFDNDELALHMTAVLAQRYPGMLAEHYGITESEDGVAMIYDVADKRHIIKAGGEADYSKAARLILDDIKNGRMGRLSLESPSEI